MVLRSKHENHLRNYLLEILEDVDEEIKHDLEPFEILSLWEEGYLLVDHNLFLLFPLSFDWNSLSNDPNSKDLSMTIRYKTFKASASSVHKMYDNSL